MVSERSVTLVDMPRGLGRLAVDAQQISNGDWQAVIRYYPRPTDAPLVSPPIRVGQTVGDLRTWLRQLPEQDFLEILKWRSFPGNRALVKRALAWAK